MRNLSSMSSKDWVRLAAKASLLFTEPKVRAAVGNKIKDSVSDLTDNISDKYDGVSGRVSDTYDEAAERLEAAADALQGRSFWASRATGFLLGVGIGAGLGILLAPASGSETREAVRDKAAEVTGRIRDKVTRMPATGTEA